MVQALLKSLPLVLKVSFYLALIAAGYLTAYWRYDAQVESMRADMAAKVREIEQAVSTKVYEKELEAEVEKAEIEPVVKVVTKEVIRYVERDTGTCTIDADWVRLHNAAASERMPSDSEASSSSDGSTSRARALEVVTDNYAKCHALRRSYMLLRNWASAVSETSK